MVWCEKTSVDFLIKSIKFAKKIWKMYVSEFIDIAQ